MANETTVQPPCIQEISEVDENLPPEVTTSAETSYVDGHFSAQPSRENIPLSETCTYTTPPHGSGKKSQMAGLSSALTPILKYLNIGTRRASSEPLKGNPRLNLPTFTTVNCQKSNGVLNQHPTSYKEAPMCWIDDESLPELTFLDDTCDTTVKITRNASTLPHIVPASPVSPYHPSMLRSSTDAISPLTKVSSNTTAIEAIAQAGSVSKNNTQTSFDKNQESSAAKTDNCSVKTSTAVSEEAVVIASGLQNKSFEVKANGTVTLSESESPQTIASTKGSNCDLLLPKLSRHNWTLLLDDRYLKEITLLDITCDSDQSPGAEISPLDVKKDIQPVDVVKHKRTSSELSELIVAEPGEVETSQGEGLSRAITDGFTQTNGLLKEQSTSLEESIEAARDISMCSVLGNNTSKLCEVNLVNSQPLVEDTLGLHPANVTRDLSSSSDMSVQCTASQQSFTSDMQCNTSLKHATSECQAESVYTSSSVEANKEEQLTRPKLTGDAPQPSPKRGGSINNTFTVTQPSKLSTTTDINTTDQMSYPHNNTMDLPPSILSIPKAECEATEQASAKLNKTPEMSLAPSQNNSGAKASTSFEVQNATFDRLSLQKSNGSSISGEADSVAFCPQNNTFDTKPPCKQNGTIGLSETSSSDSHQNIVDIPAPLKVCHPTIIQDNSSEVNPPEVSKQNTTLITDSNTKIVDSTESTFDANPVVEAAFETERQSVTGLSDTMDNQGINAENNKANTFNLDDTFDMKSDPLVTSTPMTHCKVFHFSTENMESKTIGPQKKLYRDGASHPLAQVSSDVPANIVSDRKTFLTQPAAKSLLPPLKAASQLLKYKPASTLPGRCEPFTSNLPMTRQRIQVEAFKNPASSEAAKGTTGISSCYNLRSTTSGSKQPNSVLLRPQMSGIPSANQRTAPGLRPPSARSIAPPSSSADKLRGPTAINPVTKTTQTKKHLLARSEPLPIAKRKKLEAPVPSSCAGATTLTCDAVNRAKNLKQPATAQRTVPAQTQSYGCAKCVVLEEQLKIKSEEIRRLKEELLKYSKQEES